jgi:hypothetical protein
VGHDVAGLQNVEDLAKRRRCLADVYNQRKADRTGDLLRDANRRHPPLPDDLVARSHLDAPEHIAVRLNTRGESDRVEHGVGDQLADAIDGDEPDGADVEKGKNRKR